MLSELYDLAQVLKAAGTGTSVRHQFFQPLPRSTRASRALWIYLAEKGSCEPVAGVSLFPEGDGSAQYLKWQPAKGNAFPAFKVHSLCKLPWQGFGENLKEIQRDLAKAGDDQWPNLQGRIRELIAAAENDWADILARTNKNLKHISGQVAEMLGPGNFPDSCQAVRHLIERSQAISAEALFCELKRHLVAKVLADPASAKDFIGLLLFSIEKPRDKPPEFQVLLELCDWAEKGLKYPANHQQIQRWMNERFLDYRDKELKKGPTMALDAFGRDEKGAGGSYPQARIPVLGNVTLRAMAAEIPSQLRYEMIEGASFRAGQESRDEMSSALEWLACSTREGKTWRNLSNKASGTMVLFTYPSRLPELAPAIACLLVGGDQGKEIAKASFEVVAAQVVDTLNGISAHEPDAQVNVFVLGQPDGHRTKVLTSESHMASHFIQSARQWQDTARAIPSITIRTFQNSRDGKPAQIEPCVPSPAELVWCINTTWQRTSGKEKTKRPLHPEIVKGLTFNDGLALLLGSPQRARPVVALALHAAVNRAAPFIGEIGMWAGQGKAMPVDKNYIQQPLFWPCILGILLGRLNVTKGGIMKSPTFLVGRMMGLTDQLHYQYCMAVRKGDVPPQLAGNALLSVAMDRPERALALFKGRANPYLSWAQTVQKGEIAGLAEHLLAELGKAADELSKLDLPKTCTDTDRAQMLLGYLARPEKAYDSTQPVEKAGG